MTTSKTDRKSQRETIPPKKPRTPSNKTTKPKSCMQILKEQATVKERFVGNAARPDISNANANRDSQKGTIQMQLLHSTAKVITKAVMGKVKRGSMAKASIKVVMEKVKIFGTGLQAR